MATVGGLDVKIAMEKNPVGRVGNERMHLLDELWIVQPAVLVWTGVDTPLGNRKRLTVFCGEIAPEYQAIIAMQENLLPHHAPPLFDLRGGRTLGKRIAQPRKRTVLAAAEEHTTAWNAVTARWPWISTRGSYPSSHAGDTW